MRVTAMHPMLQKTKKCCDVPPQGQEIEPLNNWEEFLSMPLRKPAASGSGRIQREVLNPHRTQEPSGALLRQINCHEDCT
jgi:hypothetical protein